MKKIRLTENDIENLVKKIIKEEGDFSWVENNNTEIEDFNNFLNMYGYSILFYRDSDKKDYMLKLEDKVIMYHFASRFDDDEITIDSVVKDIKKKIKDLEDPNDELTHTGRINLTSLKRLVKIIKKELGIKI
jgi:hypothetical protein